MYVVKLNTHKYEVHGFSKLTHTYSVCCRWCAICMCVRLANAACALHMRAGGGRRDARGAGPGSGRPWTCLATAQRALVLYLFLYTSTGLPYVRNEGQQIQIPPNRQSRFSSYVWRKLTMLNPRIYLSTLRMRHSYHYCHNRINVILTMILVHW